MSKMKISIHTTYYYHYVAQLNMPYRKSAFRYFITFSFTFIAKRLKQKVKQYVMHQICQYVPLFKIFWILLLQNFRIILKNLQENLFP